MIYARRCAEAEASGMDTSSITPPPPADTSHLVPCPHCNRKFNDSAAEKHIPRCKEIKEREAFKSKNKKKRK